MILDTFPDPTRFETSDGTFRCILRFTPEGLLFTLDIYEEEFMIHGLIEASEEDFTGPLTKSAESALFSGLSGAARTGLVRSRQIFQRLRPIFNSPESKHIRLDSLLRDPSFADSLNGYSFSVYFTNLGYMGRNGTIIAGTELNDPFREEFGVFGTEEIVENLRYSRDDIVLVVRSAYAEEKYVGEIG